MKKIKYFILVTAGKINTEKISKMILEKLGKKDLPEPSWGNFGVRDEKGDLDFSFLELKDGNGKVIITESDNTIRQINMSILKGSLEREGKQIPENCKKVKGIQYDEVEAYFIGVDGNVEALKVDDTGISVPVYENWIEEMNLMMEDLYYTLKYSDN